MEKWKTLSGMSYSVCESGEVFSHITHKILKPRSAGDGYFQVTLCGVNYRHTWYVHRLVATVFIPNPENKPEINHKNGIKADNRADNLEWATISENRQHAYDTGLRTASMPNFKGTQLPQSKFTESDVLMIRQRHKNGELQKHLAKEFGVSPVTIWSIVHRKNWKHI